MRRGGGRGDCGGRQTGKEMGGDSELAERKHG